MGTETLLMTPVGFAHLAGAWVLAVGSVAMVAVKEGGTLALAVIAWRLRVRQAAMQATIDQHDARIASNAEGVQTALAAAPPPQVIAGPVIAEVVIVKNPDENPDEKL